MSENTDFICSHRREQYSQTNFLEENCLKIKESKSEKRDEGIVNFLFDGLNGISIISWAFRLLSSKGDRPGVSTFGLLKKAHAQQSMFWTECHRSHNIIRMRHKDGIEH